jgi:hypothetical protein
MREAWLGALYSAGAVPASHVPPGSPGRADLEEVAGAAAVEDRGARDLRGRSGAAAPRVATFLDGIQYWKVIGYDGVVPIVRAPRRGAGAGRPPPAHHRRDAPRAAWSPRLACVRPARAALERSGLPLVDLPAEEAGQPGGRSRARAARWSGHRSSSGARLGERVVAALAPESGWWWTACSPSPPCWRVIRARSA